MKKEEAIKIITSCAKQYKENLENRNLLFIFKNEKGFDFFQAVFLPRNFLHLTGVEVNEKTVKSTDFYEMCLKGQLSPSLFEIASDGTTDMKLSILPQIMIIYRTAKMVGEYDYSKSLLVTEKIAGSVTACLGFVRDGEYYIPNTALKEDIRDITLKPQQRIIAIFSKSKDAEKFTHLCYTAKGVNLDNITFPAVILDKIDFNNIVCDYKAINSLPYYQMPNDYLSARKEASITNNTSVTFHIERAQELQCNEKVKKITKINRDKDER